MSYLQSLCIDIFYLTVLDNFVKGNVLFQRLDNVKAGDIYNSTQWYGEGYGREWIYFPDGEGVPHYVKLTRSDEELKFVKPRSAYSELEFRLYTNTSGNKDNYTILNEFAEPIVSMYDFDLSNLPLKIITHGWRSSSDSVAVSDIRDAYIQSHNANIITVDWSYTSSSIFYHWVANQTLNIGTELAIFLASLSQRYNVTGDQIHLIGHSLGAHIMGIAAYYYRKNSINFTIDRITGLDPARPLFEYPVRDDIWKLDASDANFVDVIHTCGGVLGIDSAIGTVDFYPNSGIPPQPGCETIPMILEACSHGRSYYYFAESITNPKAFLSYQCNDWDEYLSKKCEHPVYMGEKVSRNITGKFYLKTNSKPPYGFQLLVLEIAGLETSFWRLFIPYISPQRFAKLYRSTVSK